MLRDDIWVRFWDFTALAFARGGDIAWKMQTCSGFFS
jgi:hypothetical protein